MNGDKELALEKRRAEKALRAQGKSRSEARRTVATMKRPALQKVTRPGFFERIKARLST